MLQPVYTALLFTNFFFSMNVDGCVERTYSFPLKLGKADTTHHLLSSKSIDRVTATAATAVKQNKTKKESLTYARNKKWKRKKQNVQPSKEIPN